MLYLDAIRAVACLSVVMLHSSMNFAMLEIDTADFWLGNIFDSISRAAVPLFIMVSGALLLDEQYVFSREKLRNHLIRYAVFFIFWSSAYACWFEVIIPIVKYKPIDAVTVLTNMVNGYYHLWFIPMIMGLYMLTPLLRLWVTRKNLKYVEYFLGLSFVFSYFLPQIMGLLRIWNSSFESITLPNGFNLEHLGYVTYFIFGWYLSHKRIENTRVFCKFAIASAGITIIGTYLVFLFSDTKEFIFYDNFSVNVFVYSTSIFVVFKSAFVEIEYSDVRAHKWIQFIVNYSLGIYAVHALYIWLLYRIFEGVTAIVSIPAIFVLTSFLSIITVAVIKRIPIIRKTV